MASDFGAVSFICNLKQKIGDSKSAENFGAVSFIM